MIGLLFNYRAMAAGHGSFLVKESVEKTEVFSTLSSQFSGLMT